MGVFSLRSLNACNNMVTLSSRVHMSVPKFKSTIGIVETGDLSDLNHMVLCAKQAGLRISEMADLVRFSHTTISRVCRE